MQKYLIVGDVHFSQYSSIVNRRGKKYSCRLENLIECLNWVQDFSREQNIDKEIYLGDFFERPSLEAEEITALQEINWNDKPKTFLVGNHDSNISTLDFSSTKIFEFINNSTVVSSPMNENINDNITFTYIPYIIPTEDMSIHEYMKWSYKNVIFAHEDLRGLSYGKYVTSTGFDVNEIARGCTLFLDGHLHNGCKIGDNIILVGNLTGQNFTEDANLYKHSVYIMTIDDSGYNITLDRYDVPCAMNFYKFKINTLEDLEQLKSLTNNDVVSVTCNTKYFVECKELIESLDLMGSRINIFYESDGIDQSEESIDFTVRDHIQQFINFVRANIEDSKALEEELSLLGGGLN